MRKLNLLQKSILATVCYYDVFNHPLTGFEVFKYLINPLFIINKFGDKKNQDIEPVRKNSYISILKELKNIPQIEEEKGFYFLRGRKEIVKTRINRQKIAISRWKKVYKIVKFLQICPFIKMIAVCNGLAIRNSKKEADIDFFIIIKKGRIWMTRFFITFLIWIIGEWRHKNKIKERICLSFYITEQALNLKNIAIQPYDIYLAHWILELKPVHYHGDIYKKFFQENKWLEFYFLNFGQILNEPHPQLRVSKWAISIRKILEKILKGRIGDLIEKLFKLFEKRKIISKLTAHDIPTAVVISDEILKFHENDKRKYFQEKFEKKLESSLDFRGILF